MVANIPHIDSSNTPRWLKSPISKSEKMCAIIKCPNVGVTTLQKTTSEKLSEVLQSLSLDLTASSITLPVPLCKSHYLNYDLQSFKPHPKTLQMYHLDIIIATKLCPQPSTIEKHLREKMGFDGKIGVTDLVCYSCYRSHLYILKQNKFQ